MTTLEDLYVHYCRRCACKANSRLRDDLRKAFEEAGETRVLTTLDVSDNYVGPKGFQPVMMLAANLDSIERVDASNNMLTHESLESLVEVLSRHRGVREVSLRNNAFHDASAHLLLHLLRTNWRITDLNVAGNHLTPNTLAKLEEQLVANRAAVSKATEDNELLSSEQKAVLQEREKQRYTPWVATADCDIDPLRSGGSLHFASWRENPQYHLFTSHSTHVTITMSVHDPIPTRLCGFAVLRGSNMLRVVDISTDPTVVVAESNFNEASVTMTLNLPAAPRSSLKPYVIVPLTFQPRKELRCTITASIASDIEGALVKLEPIDLRGDWFVQRLEGRWIAGGAGGSITHPSWRRNPMFRMRYTGGPTPGKATITFVLSKANDDDDNDERAIGLYALAPDSKGRRPIRAGAAYPASVVAALDHKQAATRVFTMQRRCDAEHLDLFIMPSTEIPFQEGGYNLTMYSTCDLEVTESPYSDGWYSRRIGGGVWDAQRSGGSRVENPTTWPHNPCYEVEVTGNEPADVHIQLEAAVDSNSTTGAASNSSSSTRRGGTIRDVGVLLVKVDDELTPVAQAPWVPASKCTWGDLWVTELEPGKYFALPVTRVAGLTGTYELEITASRALSVSLETPLNVRLRQRQLQRYDEDTAARKAAQQAELEALDAADHSDAAAHHTGVVPADIAAAAEQRSAVMTAYHQTGSKFVDRDFPRGPTSLWKNAMEQPVMGEHPNVFAWRRPDEISSRAEVMRCDDELGAVPQGYGTGWVHSALAAVATRPAWHKNMLVAAQPSYGLYQVRFFKAGEWRTVTVDDFLPVDAAGDLCFARSLDPNSVLAPIVEKAYAKLHRCYEALDDATSSTQLTELDVQNKSDDTSDSCDAGYSLLSRALSDFTGGVSFERRLYDKEGKAWCYKGMWSHLQTCRDATRVIALRLSPATPRAMEKKEHGIFLNRLYPVVNTREVEGEKLVKLRNFWGWGTQDAGAATEWRGKWHSGSERWTHTIRRAVSFNPEDKTTFWMSAEEVIFYFGVVHTVDCSLQRAWVNGGFACNAPGGDLQSDSWPQNPQYALRVECTEPCDVIVGLHQPDALLTLTREDTARVDYRATLGLVTIRTDDDRRKLVTVTDKEVPFVGPSGAQRDLYYKVRYDPTCSYVVMPHNATPLRESNFSVSVSAPSPVSLAPIGSDLCVSIDGEWTADSAGGPSSAATWRDNPQFLVYATEETTATIVLRQRNDICSTTDAIGFTVVAARDIRRAMNYSECDVIAEASYDNARAVQLNVRLQATRDRLGMPYLIIPSTAKAGAFTGFSLEVICNARVALKPLDSELDFRRTVIRGTMSFDAGNSGGSTEHSSWRCNPQYAVTFPVEKSGELVVSLSKRTPSDAQEITLYAFKPDTWDHGRRRKVHLADPKREVLAKSPVTSSMAVDVRVPFDQLREPILIMPCTAIPFSECDYQLNFYCTCDFRVHEVTEWEQHDAQGSWELGSTAGGAKERCRSWVNNPFYALNVTRPTRLIIVTVQYPRGPERQVVRRVGKHRVLVPPPIINDRSKVCFGFDLCRSNGDANVMSRYSVVSSTKHTLDAEIVMTTKLEACDTEPYYIVPHTYDPELEADFRVFVYADQPVQLYPLEKPRLTYA